MATADTGTAHTSIEILDEPLIDARTVSAWTGLKTPTVYQFGRERPDEMGTVRWGRKMMFRPDKIRQLIVEGGLRTNL